MKSTRANRSGRPTVLSRRDLLGGLAIGAGALSASGTLKERAEAREPTDQEEHEFISKTTSFDKTAQGVVFHCVTTRGTQVDVAVTVCTPEIIRVQMCPDEHLKAVKSLLDIKEDWPFQRFTVSETESHIVIDTGRVRFQVQRDPWKYAVRDTPSEPLLQEHVSDVDVIGDCRSLPIGFTRRNGQFCRSNETFYLAPGEHLYGFGETFTRLDKVGQTHDGWLTDSFGTGSHEVYKHIPFLLSTRGYGVFFNSTSRLHAQVGSQSLMAYTVTIDHPRLDLFLIYGPSLKQVLARYIEIAGAPAFPPKASFGIWTMPLLPHGKDVDGYVALVKRFRDLDIPIDLVLPGVYLLSNRETSTDEELLALTTRLCEAMARIGIKTLLYTQPMLTKGSPMEQEALAHNYVLTHSDGSPYEALLTVARPERFPGKDLSCTLEAVTRSDEWRDKVLKASRAPCLLVDFTNPDAVTWWKSKIAARMKAGCYGIGMSDFGEDIPEDATYHNGRSGLEMHNVYSLLYQKACYEAVAESSEHRSLINARSGTAGIQRFPICWSGDPNCTWQDMANTLRAGLSIGLSGVPFWSCDNAGFNDARGDLTPELWIRWSQWSMFLSHVRLNGMGPVRAPWSFGELAVENFRKYAKLRYRLLPYIYSHAFHATNTGVPIIRAMVLEFQDDPSTHTIEDQYMFGDSLLVAPVCTPDNRRTVYLPKGTWYDYDTGQKLDGPLVLHMTPTLGQLPLFAKNDSIIPLGPDLTYVGERALDPITLDIRLSSEAAFTLYDDEESVGTREIVNCRATRERRQIVLDVGASQKTYVAKFNRAGAPVRVTLDGAEMPRRESAAFDALQTGWHVDASQTVYVKFRSRGRKKRIALAYA